jgi:hypothetical protein
MNLQEQLDELAAMAEAVAFSKNNGQDNRWLVEDDDWIARAMTAATTDEDFQQTPDPSRAIVVLSNDLSAVGFGNSVHVEGRRWWYASDLAGAGIPASDLDPFTGKIATACHKCASEDLFGSALDVPAVAIVHIPRGRFVVEFAFCRDCMIHLASLADAINERARIQSGDTYVEFERSARVGEDDTEV